MPRMHDNPWKHYACHYPTKLFIHLLLSDLKARLNSVPSSISKRKEITRYFDSLISYTSVRLLFLSSLKWAKACGSKPRTCITSWMRVAESKVPASAVKWRGATLTCPEKKRLQLALAKRFVINWRQTMERYQQLHVPTDHVRKLQPMQGYCQ